MLISIILLIFNNAWNYNRAEFTWQNCHSWCDILYIRVILWLPDIFLGIFEPTRVFASEFILNNLISRLLLILILILPERSYGCAEFTWRNCHNFALSMWCIILMRNKIVTPDVFRHSRHFSRHYRHITRLFTLISKLFTYD